MLVEVILCLKFCITIVESGIEIVKTVLRQNKPLEMELSRKLHYHLQFLFKSVYFRYKIKILNLK